MRTTQMKSPWRVDPTRTPLPVCVIILAVSALAGCGPADTEDDVDTETMEARDAQPVASAGSASDTVVTANLAGEGEGYAAIQGEVAVIGDSDGPLSIVLDARGLPPGEHAWHIHAGPCAASTDVVIALSATADQEAIVGPLTVDQTGAVNRTAEVAPLTRSMVGGQRHSLHIHAMSGVDHGPSIACATI